MKQPELGKKIAELRRAKGLTQEELIEKCKINVRTLQRIENGEASPRSYTIKIIFAALDYNFYDSTKSLTSRFIRIERTVSKWLEQLYKYVIDLFNLKTNTLKKLTILSIPFLTICIVFIFSINSSAKAQANMTIRKKFESTCLQSKIVQWFNADQIDSISMLYLDNAYMMPGNAPTIYGKENIKESYRMIYNQGYRYIDAKSTFRVISDSIAVDRGTFTMSINSMLNITGIYLLQYRYINDKWMIENDMTKADNINVGRLESIK